MKKQVLFSRHSPETKEIKRVLKEKYLAMSEEEYMKLKGKDKSYAALIRNQLKGQKPPNPKGKNQYTEDLLVKELINSNRTTTLAALDQLRDPMVARLKHLMFHGKSEITQLQAIQLGLSYSIGKPEIRKAPPEAKGKSPMLVVPAQEINTHNEEIKKVKIINNPEKK